jgi:enoyl-[acyl-carrier protein] reductase/trans-2-enoyl-CoA reductase (NAD+)
MPVPVVRNNVCLNVHPRGCAALTESWIERTRKAFASGGQTAGGTEPPRSVLVIGCSTGFGLASRIAASFGCGAATVGLSYERGPTGENPGTPGWYNNRAFDGSASSSGLFSRTIESDAFSIEAKNAVLEAIARLPHPVDLVVYSIASPVRTDPETGVMYRSVLKPIGRTYSGFTVDLLSGDLKRTDITSASREEIAATVKVMGGEDWLLWAEALLSAGALAPNARTVAFSYVGPALSHAIYREGTLGKAKENLEATVAAIDALLSPIGGKAFVSVNKAVSTRASAVIPGLGLYLAVLYRVMKEKGVHEDCLDQAVRLFRDRLYARDGTPTDDAGLIRLDELELRDDVQAEVAVRMKEALKKDLSEFADVDGVRNDFLQAHGFAVPGIEYGDTPS